jgi:ABC-type transport system involved in cytochrome c biogenesis permease subunit
MKAILDVKRTVTQYVWFNIAIFTISFLLLLYGFLRNGEEGREIINAASEAWNEAFFWVIFALICIAVVSIILALIWLFYRVVYGILLRRLRNNYNELKQLDL